MWGQGRFPFLACAISASRAPEYLVQGTLSGGRIPFLLLLFGLSEGGEADRAVLPGDGKKRLCCLGIAPKAFSTSRAPSAPQTSPLALQLQLRPVGGVPGRGLTARGRGVSSLLSPICAHSLVPGRLEPGGH